MTALDYTVIAIVVISALVGLWRGFVSEILALAAWLLAFVAARMFGPEVGRLLDAWLVDAGLQTAAGMALVFVFVLLLASLARWLARSLIRAAGLGLPDRMLGSLFGLARAAVILLVCTVVASMTTVPKQSWWREAAVSKPLETAVLAMRPWLPSSMARRISFS